MVTKDAIFRSGIIPRGSRVFVGVSGGVDSTALLHLLFSLRHELALDIGVLHYDHALRRGSSKDRIFVQQMSRSMGLKCVWARNTTRLPKGVSVEDFARRKRFEFFIRVAKKFKADAVALAHTQDDLAETVLMRILRGTGLAGLRSILPQRLIGGVMFARPLLGVKRSELEQYLSKIGVAHIEDPSNQGDEFFRNRIRHKLIPYLVKEFSPAAKEKLAELAMTSSLDYEFIEKELQKAIAGVVIARSRSVRVLLKPLEALPKPLKRMALRHAFSKASGASALSFDHLMRLEQAACSGKKEKIVFSNGIKAVISDKFITLS